MGAQIWAARARWRASVLHGRLLAWTWPHASRQARRPCPRSIAAASNLWARHQPPLRVQGYAVCTLSHSLQRPARPHRLAPAAHRSRIPRPQAARCVGGSGCAPSAPPTAARRRALLPRCHGCVRTIPRTALMCPLARCSCARCRAACPAAAAAARPSRPGARAMGAAASSEAGDFTAMVREGGPAAVVFVCRP